MPGTIDPTRHSTLHCIHLSIVVRNVLCEASLEEWHFFASCVEMRVTHWHDTIGHGNAMLHRDVVKWLIPGESWQ